MLNGDECWYAVEMKLLDTYPALAESRGDKVPVPTLHRLSRLGAFLRGHPKRCFILQHRVYLDDPFHLPV